MLEINDQKKKLEKRKYTSYLTANNIIKKQSPEKNKQINNNKWKYDFVLTTN